jgi:hypothetical protein
MKKVLIISVFFLLSIFTLRFLLQHFTGSQYNLVYCRGGSYIGDVKFNGKILEEIYSSELADEYPCYIFDTKTSEKTAIKFYDYAQKEDIIKTVKSPDNFMVQSLNLNTGYPDETGGVTGDVYITKYPLNFYRKYIDTEFVPGDTFFVVGWYKASSK